MEFYILLVYFLILIAILVIGAIKLPVMDLGLKLFYSLLVCTFISEIIATFYDQQFHTKAPVYHFFSILELSFYLLFFSFTIFQRLQLRTILVCVLLSATVGLGNLFFLQPLNTYNTNMLMFQCLAVVCMALYALFKIANREAIINIIVHPYFQIWMSVLVLWTGTFFFFSFLTVLKNQSNYAEIIAPIQGIYSILIYAWFAIIFYKLKKAKV